MTSTRVDALTTCEFCGDHVRPDGRLRRCCEKGYLADAGPGGDERLAQEREYWMYRQLGA